MFALLRAPLCALALLALQGCGDVPLAPSAVSGLWALETVNRHPVPTLVLSEGDTDVLLASDTILLGSGGTFTGTRCDLRIVHAQQQASTTCTPYHGSYRLRVRTIELRHGCQLGANCMGGDIVTGTIEAAQLVLRAGGSAPELGYSRVE